MNKPEIPKQIIDNWQRIANLMAKILKVPAGLIMKVHSNEIEVFVSSQTENNPYEVNEKAKLNTGLYCETVIAKRQILIVPDALKAPEWNQNPDIELGMTFYLGYPIEWPDGDVFGTICVLDSKENINAIQYKELLLEYKFLIEKDLAILVESENNKRLEKSLKDEKEKIQSYLDIMGTMLCTLDENEKVALINKKGCELLGCPEKEILGKNWFTNFLPKRIQKQIRDVYHHLMNGELEPVENYENEIINSREEEILIAFQNRILRDSDNKICGILFSGIDITAERKAKKALQESELWLTGIFNALEEAVLVVTSDRTLVNINKAAINMFGYTENELKSLSTKVLHVDEDHFIEFGKRIQSAFKNNDSARFEFEAKRKNGEIFPTEHTVSLLTNENNKPLGIVSVVRDITERKLAEKALQDSYNIFSKVLNSMDTIVSVVELKSKHLLFANEQFKKISNGEKCLFCEEFLSVDKNIPCNQCNEEYFNSCKNKGTNSIVWEIKNNKNNKWYQVYSRMINWVDEQNVVLEIAYDITHLKELEEKLEYLSYNDELTKVANRRYFNKIFLQEWKNSVRHQTCLSLIMLDIDYFKLFNDNYGHLKGDKCLYQVAQLIEKQLKRPKDFLARYGGEEFILLLPDTNLDGALSIANDIKSAIEIAEIPHNFSDISSYLTLSMGVTSGIPNSEMNYEKFIMYADKLLYESKQKGRNCISSNNYPLK